MIGCESWSPTTHGPFRFHIKATCLARMSGPDWSMMIPYATAEFTGLDFRTLNPLDLRSFFPQDAEHALGSDNTTSATADSAIRTQNSHQGHRPTTNCSTPPYGSSPT